MQVETYHIADYLRSGERSHVARKQLARRWPEKAHDHDYYEVFCIESGQTDHWINGQREALAPGHLSFIRPNDTHAFRADQAIGCGILNVMVPADIVRHLRERYAAEFAHRLFDAQTEMPEAFALGGARLDSAVRLMRGLVGARMSLARVEAFLLTMANDVVSAEATVPARVPRWLAEACESVREPAVFRGGAPAFIAAAGRSHEHVCRACRQFLDTTPTDYINRIRAEFAADRLAHSSTPISAIAAECGLENVSHFYRVFRSHYGTTPRAFRLHNQRSPF
ncbi:MAG: AraC family transcriptional regulator [Pseudomonadota bacterium]